MDHSKHSGIVVVQTTTASQADAERIGLALLQQGLAACVQYQAIRSQYRWQGAVQCDDEVRLNIKTAAHLFARVEAAIVALHRYDCPQIIMLPVAAAHRPYADWVRAALTPKRPA